MEVFGRSSKDKLAWNVVSGEAQSHLTDTGVFVAPGWLCAARRCTVKEEDGFRVHSDGSDKELPAVV